MLYMLCYRCYATLNFAMQYHGMLCYKWHVFHDKVRVANMEKHSREICYAMLCLLWYVFLCYCYGNCYVILLLLLLLCYARQAHPFASFFDLSQKSFTGLFLHCLCKHIDGDLIIGNMLSMIFAIRLANLQSYRWRLFQHISDSPLSASSPLGSPYQAQVRTPAGQEFLLCSIALLTFPKKKSVFIFLFRCTLGS